MATITHRGITYNAESGTPSVNIDLQLQGGVDQDETTWISAYPGALTDFEARQTDGTNRFNPRLVCLSLSGALADTNTLTLSGQCSKILSVVGQHLDATAIMGITKTSDLVLTFALKQHDDSAADVTATELWLLVV